MFITNIFLSPNCLQRRKTVYYLLSVGNYICIKCWELNRNAYIAEEQNCSKFFSFFSSCKSLHLACHSSESSYFSSFVPDKSLTLLILICLLRMLLPCPSFYPSLSSFSNARFFVHLEHSTSETQ